MDGIELAGWITVHDRLIEMAEGAEIAREQGPHGTPEEDHAIGVRDALRAAAATVETRIVQEQTT